MEKEKVKRFFFPLFIPRRIVTRRYCKVRSNNLLFLFFFFYRESRPSSYLRYIKKMRKKVIVNRVRPAGFAYFKKSNYCKVHSMLPYVRVQTVFPVNAIVVLPVVNYCLRVISSLLFILGTVLCYENLRRHDYINDCGLSFQHVTL